MPVIFVNSQVRDHGQYVVAADGKKEGNKCFVCALVGAIQTVIGVTLDPSVIRSVLSHVAYGVMVDTSNGLHSWDLRALAVRVLGPLDVSLIIMNGRREMGCADYWLSDGAMRVGAGRNQIYLMNTPGHFIEVLADPTAQLMAKLAIQNPIDKDEVISLLVAEGALPTALLDSAREHVMLQRDIAMADRRDASARLQMETRLNQIDTDMVLARQIRAEEDRLRAQELADEELARSLANQP
jgi:hypothetical protein